MNEYLSTHLPAFLLGVIATALVNCLGHTGPREIPDGEWLDPHDLHDDVDIETGEHIPKE